MKVKSDMILTEQFTYTLDTTVQKFFFAKGRPDGVLELVFMNVYNNTAHDHTELYFLMKHKGEELRLFYDATLGDKEIDYRLYPVYLCDGDELGIEIDGNTVGDTVVVNAQWIFHPDKDYNKPT